MEFARQVEQVIKDQSMADAFDMMEDYIHFLVDRVVQLQKNKQFKGAHVEHMQTKQHIQRQKQS